MSTSTTLWPLPSTAPRQHVIAGKTIQQHLDERLDPAIQLEPNVWLSAKDQCAMLDNKFTTLVDADGNRIASTGDGSTKIQATSSFFVHYPWQLLFIAEQIIGSLTEDKVEGEIDELARVEGTIELGKGSRLLPGVFIEGNVTIGENCKIGPNCYIRGNTSIGNGVHIGQSVEVKNCIVGNNTAIGHLSYAGDSVIGDKVNFGAGTIISNFRHDGGNHKSMVEGELVDTTRRKFGSIIADGVHTGIHTSIYPGRKIGEGKATRPGDIVQKDLF